MQIVPHALDVKDGDLRDALERLAACKKELDEVVELYTDRALAAMASAIGIPFEGPAAVLSHLRRWAEAIPPRVLDDVAEPRAKGVVSQLCSPGTDPVRLANTISARLTKAVTRWDDTEVARFQQEFRRVVDVVEEAAFVAAADGAGVDGPAKERLASLIQARIAGQAETLRKIVGAEEAARRLRDALPKSGNSKPVETRGGLFNGTT